MHPSSHETPNEINGAVFIFGKMCICLDSLLRPDRWSVVMCEDSIVLSSGSLVVVSFEIITGAILLVACFVKHVLATESAIASIFLLVGLGGVLIQLLN